ncbi:MAG: type VII secretion protein EssC [Suipraeoptans sp.]
MITVTLKIQEQIINIMVRTDQQIVEVMKILIENARIMPIDNDVMTYSHRQKEYVDKMLTFDKARVFSGDILEIKSKSEELLGNISNDDMFPGEEYKIYERAAGKQIFIAESSADINITGLEDKILIEKDELIRGDKIYKLEEGAIIFLAKCRIVVGKEYIKIWGEEYTTGLSERNKQSNINKNYPIYKRSPRIIKKTEDRQVSIDIPPPAKKQSKKALLMMILPPLAMLLITVTIGVLLKRGLFMLMSVGATVMTTIFSVVKYFQDKREGKEEEKKKVEVYGNYLLKKRKEIYRLWNNELQAYGYNFPTLEALEMMVSNVSSRIFERASMDDDFLNISVGEYYDTPQFRIDDKSTGLELESDVYSEEIKDLKRRYGVIKKPQVIDIKNGHLGLVGEKNNIHEQLKNYICQLSFMQSYHDVQYVAIYNEKYDDDFQWMKWLSHTRIKGLNVLGLINTDKMRDQILGSIQQILKNRKQALEEGKKETRFLPHYVFIIDEPKMIIDHSIMEYLSMTDSSSLGITIIYSSNMQASLPDYIDSILLLENSDDGRLLIHENELIDRKLVMHEIANTNLEMFARNLGVLEHEQGIVSHIPESITFFDMYDIRNPEELNIAGRWSSNNSSKTLSVPLGARTKEDILELNLHEKAHGPHGLVAGTTGSGKSEIVQSYILSLAVNFHPHEVGFLLIDYKGGGMANLFKNLPHLLGTITNLDGSESMRALASIQSELRRRQTVFGEHEVNHINAYNDLFKEGKVVDPIPHLFIISDEFAELKKEQPEFMKELVSTARIGRSLGVHLILATQKPSGVVDEQIWTNSKFKLCLKVQNEADSKEVLHTPDAANITQPGRSYLQVGNNDIYELFQSAFSGASYIKETKKEVTSDNRVYAVNALGQGELINQDLRGSKSKRSAKETQLEVVVDYIQREYTSRNDIEVKKPWLPSLEDIIVNPNMDINKASLNLEVAIGMRDIPEEQRQDEYRIDLIEQGNILYIASGGFGKSVFLTNTALQLAVKNEVSNLNMYVIDIVNNALISLSSIPHVDDYVMLDDEEKFVKFRELIAAEMLVRKKMMAKAMAQNFTVYNETNDAQMKAIVILIDNYDAIKEMSFEMEEYFTKLTRDGVGLGIYCIVTASRNSAVRAATLNNFKSKIAGVNFDESEIKVLVGRSQYTLPEVRGRALVKEGEMVSVMQLYTPVMFESDINYTKNVQGMVSDIREAFDGDEAPHIPILPEELNYIGLEKYQEGKGDIYLGLDKESVRRIGFDSSNNPFIILGENTSGKTNVLQIVLNQLKDKTYGKTYIIDSKKRSLYAYKSETEYIMTLDELEDLTNEISTLVKERKQKLDSGILAGGNPTEIISKFDNIYIVIDDIDDFCDLAGNSLTIIAMRFEQAAALGVTFIVAANVSKFKGNDNFTKFIKSSRNGILLSSQGYLTIFPVKVNEVPAKPDAQLMIEGECKQIRVPKYEV